LLTSSRAFPLATETSPGLELHQRAITVVLVEQNAKLALKISDYGLVFETGSVTLHGPSEELLKSEAITNAYLGGSEVGGERYIGSPTPAPAVAVGPQQPRV
jgi:ABC-type hemin transport system ATPase subunit